MNHNLIVDLVMGVALLVVATVLGVLMNDSPTYRLLVGAAFLSLVVCAGICAYRWLLAHHEAQAIEFRKRVGGA
jgi:hypothetical protein